ncbi:hypothetical protein Nepgr_029401 [Nepenthes gracilis]|uniref:Uncharacterized protein n=1 Tax=Nepenthes gracilis TaxID=150966 RepID=A0AAD3TCE2_NEPGR|nr:hypothetical protein Nepgr_029401 [Nepenthes gracilis]
MRSLSTNEYGPCSTVQSLAKKVDFDFGEMKLPTMRLTISSSLTNTAVSNRPVLTIRQIGKMGRLVSVFLVNGSSDKVPLEL